MMIYKQAETWREMRQREESTARRKSLMIGISAGVIFAISLMLNLVFLLKA